MVVFERRMVNFLDVYKKFGITRDMEVRKSTSFGEAD